MKAKLLADTNVVISYSKELVALMALGINIVKAAKTDEQLAKLLATGQITGMPAAAAAVPSIPDSFNIGLIVEIKRALDTIKIGADNANDAVIGATAMDDDRILVTNDGAFARAVTGVGGVAINPGSILGD